MTAPDESGNTGVAEVPETHRLDEAALTRWMEAHVESFRGPVYRKPRSDVVVMKSAKDRI